MTLISTDTAARMIGCDCKDVASFMRNFHSLNERYSLSDVIQAIGENCICTEKIKALQAIPGYNYLSIEYNPESAQYVVRLFLRRNNKNVVFRAIEKTEWLALEKVLQKVSHVEGTDWRSPAFASCC